MTPIEAVLAVVIFWAGIQAGRLGERARQNRLRAPSIYDQQNRAMEAQQRAAFNQESCAIKHILTSPLAPWQIELMGRDPEGSPGN